MKILIISDEECPALWDYYVPGRLKEYDLILSCGDLKSQYLSFLVTMARCPLLYVHGNHDTHYKQDPPLGCDCIDDQLVVYNGVRILGLGGCRKYRNSEFQYTEKQMRKRIRKLRFKLWRSGGVDIVVTHAPPEGLGDGDDPAHWGMVFVSLFAAPPHFGQVQFTDYGLSGIAVMQLSGHLGHQRKLRKGHIRLDLFPGFEKEEYLFMYLKKRLRDLSDTSMEVYFTGLLNKRVAAAVLLF